MKPKTHDDWIETFIDEMNSEISALKERIDDLEERRTILEDVLKKTKKITKNKLGF